jgi:hypothetical protein
MTMRAAVNSARMRDSAASPLSPGMRTSIKVMSGFLLRNIATA